MTRLLLTAFFSSIVFCSQAFAEVYPVVDVTFLKKGYKVVDSKSPAQIKQGAARLRSLATLMRIPVKAGSVRTNQKALLRLYVSFVEIHPKPANAEQSAATNTRLEFSRMLVNWNTTEGITGLKDKAPVKGVHYEDKPFASLELANNIKHRDILLVDGFGDILRKWSSAQLPNFGVIVHLVQTGSPAVMQLGFGALAHKIAAAVFTGKDMENAAEPGKILSIKLNNEPVISSLNIVDGSMNVIPVRRTGPDMFSYGENESIRIERYDSEDETLIRLSLSDNRTARAVRMVLADDYSSSVEVPQISIYSERYFKNKRHLNLLRLNHNLAVRWAGVRHDGANATCNYWLRENESKGGYLQTDLRSKSGHVVLQLIRGKYARRVLKNPTSANIAEELAEADGALSVLLHRKHKYVFTGQKTSVTPEVVAIPGKEKFKTSWKILDEAEREIGGGTFEIAAKTRGFLKPIEFTCTNNGVWRFSLKVTDGEKEIMKREALIAVMDRHNLREGEDSPLGFCRQAWTRHDDEYLNRLSRDIGANWFRIWTRVFLDVEFTGDNVKYTLNKRAEEVCRRIKEEQKLKILGVLGPLLFSKTNSKDAYVWCAKLKKENIGAYKKLYRRTLEVIVPKLAPYVDYWETMNEPYYEHRREVPLYIELSRMTREIVAKYDPDAKIVGTCGPPGNMGYGWFKELFEHLDLNNQDIVSFHPYTMGVNTSYLPATWARKINGLISKYGGTHALWNTEYGLHPLTFYRLDRYKFLGSMPKVMRMEAKPCAAILIKQTLSNVVGGSVKNFIFTISAQRSQALDIVEYDGTPKHLCVAFAAMNKFLRGRKFTRQLQKAGVYRLRVFAFEGKGAPLMVFTTVGYKPGESMTVSAPPGKWNYFDTYGNPLSTGADGKLTLAVDVVYAVAAKGAKLPPVGAIKILEQRRHVVKVKDPDVRDTTTPEDWNNRAAIDLAPYVNRSFTDRASEDGKGGWTDEGENDMRNLPVGKLLFNGIPFKIINPKKNNGKSCLVMKSSGGIYSAPEKQRINVGIKARRLHFLHTSTYTADKVIADIVVHFVDGTQAKLPIRRTFEIDDWFSNKKPSVAQIGWHGPNPKFADVKTYVYTYENPRPINAVKYIDVISRNSSSRYVLIAVTADVGF